MNQKMARAIRQSGREKDIVAAEQQRAARQDIRHSGRGYTVRAVALGRRKAVRDTLARFSHRKRGEFRADLLEQGRLQKAAAKHRAVIDDHLGGKP